MQSIQRQHQEQWRQKYPTCMTKQLALSSPDLIWWAPCDTMKSSIGLCGEKIAFVFYVERRQYRVLLHRWRDISSVILDYRDNPNQELFGLGLCLRSFMLMMKWLCKRCTYIIQLSYDSKNWKRHRYGTTHSSVTLPAPLSPLFLKISHPDTKFCGMQEGWKENRRRGRFAF